MVNGQLISAVGVLPEQRMRKGRAGNQGVFASKRSERSFWAFTYSKLSLSLSHQTLKHGRKGLRELDELTNGENV